MSEVLLLAGCWLEVGSEAVVNSRIGPMGSQVPRVRALHPAQAMHTISHDR